MSYTVKCVRCLKPAKVWGGHVIGGKRNPIAGWCSERCLNAGGFSGRWQRGMGESSVFPVRRKRAGTREPGRATKGTP